MMRRSSSLSGASILMLALVCLCVGVGTASAQVPYDMSYQGRLTDAVGAPLIGPVNLQMRIYDVISGGSALYIEDHIAVVVDDVGAFSLRLGAGSALLGTFDTALFAGVNRYLEVVVDGAALTPRLIIGSVPYAMHADNAASAQAAADAAQTTADAAQVRVIGSCPADFSIRSIGADGSVTCEADDDNDTTLDEAAVVSIVASNGFSTGAHTVNTDTTLDEAQVDAFVANNEYADAALVATNAAGIAALQTGVAALQPFHPASLRFEACPDGLTVADTETGLLWERKTTAGGNHDVSATFSLSSLESSNSANDGTAYTVLLAEMNTAPGFAGFADWRVPLLSELQSILIGSAVTEPVSGLNNDPTHGTNPTGQPSATIDFPWIDPRFAAIGGPVSSGITWTRSTISNGQQVAVATLGTYDYFCLFPGTQRAVLCSKTGPFATRAVRTGSCAP